MVGQFSESRGWSADPGHGVDAHGVVTAAGSEAQRKRRNRIGTAVFCVVSRAVVLGWQRLETNSLHRRVMRVTETRKEDTFTHRRTVRIKIFASRYNGGVCTIKIAPSV